MKRRLIVTLVLLAVAVLAACSTAPDTDLLEKKLQEKLEALKEESGFPGATVAAVLPDGTVVATVAGTAAPEGEAPMPRDARMFSGSTGKTFVSAVALQMIDEGKFSLDDPVSQHLGEEEWYPRLPNHDGLTVRMLLNHTGGLPRYVFHEPFWAELEATPDRVWKPEELLAYIFDAEPVHPAGEGWNYSDTDYILVGMIIEKVGGSTFYEELERRILDPLELSGTTPSTGRVHPGLVAGLTGTKPEWHLDRIVLVDGAYIFDPGWEWCGGGLVTTSSDLARWAKRLYGGNVLTGEMKAELFRAVSEETGEPSETGYGLGVFVRNSTWGKAYGHSGIFPGYQTVLEYYPDLDCSMALQVNADGFSDRLDRSMSEYLDALMPVVAEFLAE